MPYSISHTKPLTEASQKGTPKLSSLVEELQQLQQEFGDMELIRLTIASLSLQSQSPLRTPILVPFNIQLELNKLSDLYRGSPYYCIALTRIRLPHLRSNPSSRQQRTGSVKVRVMLR